MKRWLGLGVVAVFALCGPGGAPPSWAASQSATGTANWTSHNNANGSAYSPLAQIDKANIGKLGLAWFRDLPGERTLEATPLEVDGVLYFTGSYAKVYAVAATSGKLLWSYDPHVPEHAPVRMRYALPVNRGVAYAHGRVFVGTLDGRLIALDARNGKPLWSVKTTENPVQTITGAPRTFDGKVIIGNGGADFNARGYATAYDQKTGKKVWRFYMAPGSPAQNKGHPAMERAAKTWHGKYWKTGTGGGPWDSMTFDPELNRIYIGTGNASPYDPAVRSPGGGSNLYTASIVALDANTGKLVWYYQTTPRDSWDFDSTQQITIADLTIDGKRRKVLMQAPKNGFFYVIDRTDGKLISAGKIGKVTWAKRIDLKTGRPVEFKDVHYQHGPITIWPSPLGAHSWQSMSFDPATGLVYIPYMQLGLRYEKLKPTSAVSFGGLAMKAVVAGPRDGKGALLAWDPVHQRLRWRVRHDHIWNGGTLATAGGLVFQGDADGYLSAYDAATGKRLWHFYAGLGIVAAPISYAVDGKQYVSVLVGYGGSNSLGPFVNVGWKYGAQPRRILTFALGGKTALPPSAPPDMAVHALDVPGLKLNAAAVAKGNILFTENCSGCHGLNAVSSGAPAPDLRASQIALSQDNLWNVVHDGALVPLGMPRFNALDRADVGDIYDYIRAMARKALTAHKHEAH